MAVGDTTEAASKRIIYIGVLGFIRGCSLNEKPTIFYCTATTFKYVEDGLDHKAPEVVWNTNSIRRKNNLCATNKLDSVCLNGRGARENFSGGTPKYQFWPVGILENPYIFRCSYIILIQSCRPFITDRGRPILHEAPQILRMQKSSLLGTTLTTWKWTKNDTSSKSLEIVWDTYLWTEYQNKNK